MTIISYPTPKDDEYTARANRIIAQADTQVVDLEDELHDLCDTEDEDIDEEESELFVEPNDEDEDKKPAAKTDEELYGLGVDKKESGLFVESNDEQEDMEPAAKTENMVRTKQIPV